MEIFILILSSLISVVSPVNFAVDKVAESQIRSQFEKVEVLKVRVDNAPLSNWGDAKIDKIRVAGRGFFPVDDVRIEAIEIETDTIDVSRKDLFGRPTKVLLERPLGVAARVVITKEDVVRALKSKLLAGAIQRLLERRDRQPETQPSQPEKPAEPPNQPEKPAEQPNQSKKPAEQPNQSEKPRQPSRLQQRLEAIRSRVDQYRIQDPRVEFLPNQRIAVQVDIVELKTSAVLKLQAETGFEILEQRRIRFVDPAITVNGQPLTPEAARNFADNLAEQLDLKRFALLLDVQARIFKATIKDGRLEVAGFLQLPAGLKF